MLVSDLITQVKTGNLAETKVTDTSLVSFLNSSLNILYDKYSLQIKEEVFILTTETEYSLPVDFISLVKATTPNNYYRSIDGQFVKKDTGIFELALGILGDYNSIFITDMYTLKVEYPINNQPITVLYKASPKPITINNLNIRLPIRDQYLEALTMYMTYLGFMQNGGGSQNDTNKYLDRYKNACLELENNGSINKVTEVNYKFYDRGFV